MKKLIVMGCLFFYSTFSLAAMPNCWTQDGKSSGLNSEGESLSDGGFNINFDVTNLSAIQLLEILKNFNTGFLSANSYPYLMGQRIYLTTYGKSNSFGPPPNRSEVISTVNSEFNKILNKYPNIQFDIFCIFSASAD